MIFGVIIGIPGIFADAVIVSYCEQKSSYSADKTTFNFSWITAIGPAFATAIVYALFSIYYLFIMKKYYQELACQAKPAN